MKQSTAVIEFGTSKVICLIAEKNAYDEISVLGMGVCEYASAKSGSKANYNDISNALIQAVREADAQSGRRIRSVYICVPAEYTVVATRQCSINYTKGKVINEKELENLFRSGEESLNFKGLSIIHRCPVSYRIDGIPTLEPLGVMANRIEAEVCFIYGDSGFIADTTDMLKELGISVRDYISSSLGQALSYVPPVDRDRLAVLVDVGYAVTSMMLVKGEGILFHTNFAVGGRNISRDLATVMSIPYEFAEQLKRRCVFGLNMGAEDSYEAVDKASMKLVKFPATKVHEIIESRIDEIISLVLEAIDSTGILLPDDAVIYLTGGGIAFMRGVRDFLAPRLSHSVEIAEPRGTRLNKPSHSAISGVLDMIIRQEEIGTDAGMLSRIRKYIKN